MKKNYKLINCDVVNSTNFELKKILLKKKRIENICLSANNQKKGYGRRKTKWFSYKGNLHLSILLKPNCKLEQANQLSYLTSICIGEALNKWKKKINITYKWPNDILLNKKKIAGVMLETSSIQNKKIKWVIIGIGMNILHYPNLKKKEFKIS